MTPVVAEERAQEVRRLLHRLSGPVHLLQIALSCSAFPTSARPMNILWRTNVEAEAPILGHLLQRADSLEKTLMLGGTGGRREGDDRV